MAAYLREGGHEVRIVDFPATKAPYTVTLDSISSFAPDIVGLSAMTIDIFNAHQIATDLKRRDLHATTVIGGAHFTATPVESLERFPHFDCGVVGEGEITLADLMEKRSDGLGFEHVQGLVWRSESGDIFVNDPRALIEDLDSLPFPAWDLLPGFPDAYPQSPLEVRRLPAASIITSRGCPHQCTFCDRSVFGSRVRQHSAEYTLGMIRHLKAEYRVKDLMILDDNFLLERKKLNRICDSIVEEGLDLNWYCLSHIKFMTEDRLKAAKAAGCWIMEVGIESGCERVLKLLNRHTSKEQIAVAVKQAKDVGIKVKGNFIFGLPSETKESLEETISFAKSIDISLFQQNFLTVFPGCELAGNAEEYGDVERDWRKLSLWQITFIPSGLTADDLLRASKKAYREFYLRPGIILEILISITSYRAFKSTLLAVGAFLKSLLRRS
jgi:radical SAM superfamily enzyme YgiQ (UPF0313 family)